MVKHILGLPGEADLIDELSGQQIINDRFNPQRGQQIQVKPLAEHCRCAQRALCYCVEAVDARGDGCLQCDRHAHLANQCR